MGGRGAAIGGKKRNKRVVQRGNDEETKVAFYGGINLDKSGLSKRKQDFLKNTFSGMDVEVASNKYLHVRSVSNDGNKVVLRVGDDHIHKTPYGYAIDVGPKKVVYVKDWQVNNNYFGNHVLFDKKYYNVRDSKYENHNISFEGKNQNGWTWAHLEKAGKAQGYVRWQP